MNKDQFRQGDVLIEAAELPEGAKRVKVSGPVVLVEGEATGHAHRIKEWEDVELFERDGVLYVRPLKTTEVSHEEHRPIVLEPGKTFRVARQKEYTPRGLRNVLD